METERESSDDNEELIKDQNRRKILAGYKRSNRFLQRLNARDPASLTVKEKKLKLRHTYRIQKYETALHQNCDVNTSKSVTHASNGPRMTINSKAFDTRPFSSKSAQTSSSRGNDQCGRTKTVSKKTTLPSAPFLADERLGPSTSHTTAPKLQVAVLDRSQPDDNISAYGWLLLEEKILRALVDELARNEDDSFTAFDGVKWLKGVKIIACGNEKTVDFLKNCVQNVGELWPNAQLEIVPLDQVTFRTTIKVCIPPPILEDDAIFTLLKRQNKELGTADWTIERICLSDNGEGKDIWLKISTKALRSSQGIINYGLSKLSLILPTEENCEKPEKAECVKD